MRDKIKQDAITHASSTGLVLKELNELDDFTIIESDKNGKEEEENKAPPLVAPATELPLKTRKKSDYIFTQTVENLSNSASNLFSSLLTSTVNFFGGNNTSKPSSSFHETLPIVKKPFIQMQEEEDKEEIKIPQKEKEISVEELHKKNDIYKINPPNGPIYQYDYMPQIEAAMMHVFRFLAGRKYVAKATAIFDEEKKVYSGVHVKRINEFQEVRHRHLDEKDLQNPGLMKTVNENLFYRIALGDDDPHSGNLSKDGYHIDGDMLMWKITRLFKGYSKIIPSFFQTLLKFNRTPTNDSYCLNATSLKNFPDIEEKFAPFYWIAKTSVYVSSETQKTFKPFFNLSPRNAFHEDDVKIAKKMAKAPGTQTGVMTGLLKFILTDKSMYRKIISMHFKETEHHPDYPEINIIDMYTNAIASQIEHYCNTALVSDAFIDFIQKNGSDAFAEIKEKFKKENEHLHDKLIKHQQRQAQLEVMVKNCREKCTHLSASISNENGKDLSVLKTILLKKYEKQLLALQEKLKQQVERVAEAEYEEKLLTIDLEEISKRYEVVHKQCHMKTESFDKWETALEKEFKP